MEVTRHRGRRRGACLLGLAVLLICGACASPPGPQAGEAPPARGAWTGGDLVSVSSGLLRGGPDLESTLSWKGVPYARPPLGELRWRAPREALPWSGERKATRFGQPSLQFAPITGKLVGSEDCLYLNVWRPADAEDGLPVYVWIHGGGNTMGSASFVPDYYGHALASRQRLVFVSVNYRLGPLGWFAPPGQREPAAEADLDASGNYGSLDILAALGWIQENIASFGGDPGRVTIAGESAGAMNALSLLMSPRAVGLFHGAVLESGALHMVGMEAARAASSGLLAGLLRSRRLARDEAAATSLAAGMDSGESMEFLRSIPAKALFSRLRGGILGMSSWPNIYADGLVFPADGYAALDRGDWPVKLPLVVGSNKEETKLFQFLGGGMKTRSELYAAVTRYGSARWKADAVDGLARRIAALPGSPPVFAYRFDWGAPDEKGQSELPGAWGRRLGAFHTLEIPFFLGTDTINGGFMTGLLFTARNEPGRRALSALVGDYLGAFAASGDPNSPNARGTGRPAWPAWTNEPAAPKLLVLDARGGEASATPSAEAITRESLDAEMEALLEPGLLAETRKRLAGRD